MALRALVSIFRTPLLQIPQGRTYMANSQMYPDYCPKYDYKYENAVASLLGTIPAVGYDTLVTPREPHFLPCIQPSFFQNAFQDSLSVTAKALAEEGAFDVINCRWGGTVSDIALGWILLKTTVLPLSHEAFQLAKEGHFRKIENMFGCAVAEMLLGWTSLKCCDWEYLQKRRKDTMTQLQVLTVDNSMERLLEKETRVGESNEILYLSQPHDFFYGTSVDPSLEIPSLRQEYRQLLAEETLLQRQICGHRLVAMSPGSIDDETPWTTSNTTCGLKRPYPIPICGNSIGCAYNLIQKARHRKRLRRKTPKIVVSSRRKGGDAFHAVPTISQYKSMTDCVAQLNVSRDMMISIAREDVNLSSQNVPWGDIASEFWHVGTPRGFVALSDNVSVIS